MNKNKLLLIEDDVDAAYHLKEFLEDSSFEVNSFETVTDAVSNIKFHTYDLILLDINLSDFQGFEVLKFLNKYNLHIPTIVISAYSSKEYKLLAFKLGACDYVCKPIDPEELEARIWVHLKQQSSLKSIDKYFFITQGNNIFFKEKPLKLTKIEFDILSRLIKNRDQTVSRDTLLGYLSQKSRNERSLDYHIRNIRKKIGDEGSNPSYLVTEYGVGYRLNS